VDRANSVGFQRAPALHRDPEAAAWKLVPFMCTCGRTHRIRQVAEAPTPRWTFEAGMREATREALAILRHEADERMAHSQYRHFLS
jgi:hypothetical protein